MKRPIHIIIADDDEDDHFFFKEALTQVEISTYDVMSVYNGQELLDYLLRKGKFQDLKKTKPDFVVLDLNMPFLDGLSALKKMKSHPELKKIPVFILSTSRQSAELDECRALGCTECYTKPIQIENLKKIVEDILEQVEDVL